MVEVKEAQLVVSRGDAPGNISEQDGPLVVVAHGPGGHKVSCRWNIANFGTNKQKMLYSKYFEVGGYDCRLLVYPTGDAQALPGYLSVYLQISDPSSSSSKWDCFASYRLSVRNLSDDSKSVHRDSWHRFSAKKRSHGWCDFAALSSVLDPKQGFLGSGDTVQISTDITILHESVSFTRESDLGGGPPTTAGDVFSGKFVWKVNNFDAFHPLLKTQKIMSPAFPAGDCALRMSVYQSSVGGEEFLSVCLESKDTDRVVGAAERTCWCLFRLSAISQNEDARQVYRDSYGRFAADSRSGDNTSLGWNDFMRVTDFTAPDGGYLDGGCAVFSASFHVIRETTSVSRAIEYRFGGSGAVAGHASGRGRLDKRKMPPRENDSAGRFVWRIENFTKLKDLLKRRKITGLCIKSRRFTIAGKDCRLIVYPRGQSQPPTYLSLFLEVTDSKSPATDWTCFVSHRLSVVNVKHMEGTERNVSKESQNRYSRAAKDWGWREFVSLTTLFDSDAGFLVGDAVVFSAEVLVLRENTVHEMTTKASVPLPPPTPIAALESNKDDSSIGEGSTKASTTVVSDAAAASGSDSSPFDVSLPVGTSTFTWRIENFLAFKDVVETRKIFSRFFSHGPCELRVGLYESFESLCIYLESEAPAAGTSGAPPPPSANGDAQAPAKPPNYWVRYRVAVINQRRPETSVWKEATMLTRSWNNSVLQFPRVAAGAGDNNGVALLLRESLAVTCEVLEYGEVVPPPTSSSLEGVRAAVGRFDDDPTGAAAGRLAPSPLASYSSGEDDSDNEDDVISATDDEDEEEEECSEEDDEDCSDDLDLEDEDDGLEAEDESDDVSEMAREGKRKYWEGEGTLSKCLSAAGLELLGLDNHPPLLATSVAAMQNALEEAVGKQPGLVHAMVEDLQHKLESVVRVKRLILPCLTTTPNAPGSIYGVAPAALTMLMGVAPLRQHILAGVVSVIVTHCTLWRQQTAAGNTETVETLDAGKEDTSNTSEAIVSSSVDMEEVIESLRDVCVYAEMQAAERVNEEPTTEDRLIAASLLMGWLRSIDTSLMSNFPPKSQTPDGLSSLQRAGLLLDAVPAPFASDVVLEFPVLVEQTEHTAAAQLLLAKLAELKEECPEAEAALRLPVLLALGMLKLSPEMSQKVLTVAIEALPSLAAGELPSLVGLVLKLAKLCTTEEDRIAAIHSVRQRLSASTTLPSPTTDNCPPSGLPEEATLAQNLDTGALNVLRLAAFRRSQIAVALLNDIGDECRAARAGASSSSSAAGTTSASSDAVQISDTSSVEAIANDKTVAVPMLSRADVEVVLDCLRFPGPRQDLAIRALDLAISCNAVKEEDIISIVEQRKSLALVNAANIEDAFKKAVCSVIVSSKAHPLMGPSMAQRAFMAAHPIACPTDEIAMSAALSKELLLRSDMNPQNLPHQEVVINEKRLPKWFLNTALAFAIVEVKATYEDGTSSSNHMISSIGTDTCTDNLSGLLAAAGGLLRVKGIHQKSLAAALYQVAYRMYDSSEARERVLRDLARKALSSGKSPLSYILSQQQSQQQQQQENTNVTTTTANAQSSQSPQEIEAKAGEAGNGTESGTVSPIPCTSSPSAPLTPDVATSTTPTTTAAAAAVEGSKTAAVLTFDGATLDAAPVAAARLLAFLASQSSEGARIALAVALDEASAAEEKLQQASKAATAADAKHTQEVAAARSATARAQQEARKASERANEVETMLSRSRAEHHAELAGAASDKKELQAKVRTLEQQLDWVKAERDEEKSARAREVKDTHKLLTESDTQLTRLKAQRKEEQRKLLKDKSIMDARMREAEEAIARAESDIGRARSEASIAISRAEKSAADARRHAEAADRALSERNAELVSLKAAVTERESHLRVTMESARELERRLAEEQARVAALIQGMGLESASINELETYASIHEQGLIRVHGFLAKQGIHRSHHHQQQHHQQQQLGSLGSGGLPGSNGGALSGFMDPLSRSMQGSGGGSSVSNGGRAPPQTSTRNGVPSNNGGLFSGSGWGLADQAVNNNSSRGTGGQFLGQQAIPSHMGSNVGDTTAGGDGSGLDGLLGLLPSDLLHS